MPWTGGGPKWCLVRFPFLCWNSGSRNGSLQLGVSHVLQSPASFSTVGYTVLEVVEIPPFERIKMKAMVWCKGLGISHSL